MSASTRSGGPSPSYSSATSPLRGAAGEVFPSPSVAPVASGYSVRSLSPPRPAPSPVVFSQDTSPEPCYRLRFVVRVVTPPSSSAAGPADTGFRPAPSASHGMCRPRPASNPGRGKSVGRRIRDFQRREEFRRRRQQQDGVHQRGDVSDGEGRESWDAVRHRPARERRPPGFLEAYQWFADEQRVGPRDRAGPFRRSRPPSPCHWITPTPGPSAIPLQPPPLLSSLPPPSPGFRHLPPRLEPVRPDTPERPPSGFTPCFDNGDWIADCAEPGIRLVWRSGRWFMADDLFRH